MARKTNRRKTNTPTTNGQAVAASRVELDGVRYVILRENVYRRLCRKAGVEPSETSSERADWDWGETGNSLSEKLIMRRRATGLSQAELARRAGIRPETLNRIERGRTTPDFATIRKLVDAIAAAERE